MTRRQRRVLIRLGRRESFPWLGVPPRNGYTIARLRARTARRRFERAWAQLERRALDLFDARELRCAPS